MKTSLESPYDLPHYCALHVAVCCSLVNAGTHLNVYYVMNQAYGIYAELQPLQEVAELMIGALCF